MSDPVVGQIYGTPCPGCGQVGQETDGIWATAHGPGCPVAAAAEAAAVPIPYSDEPPEQFDVAGTEPGQPPA